MSDISIYRAGERDAIEYQLKVVVFTLVLFSCFAAFASGLLPLWMMVFFVTVMLTRWMIAFHELLHLRKAEELDLVTRLFPLPFSPINLGYREYREIHIGHHRHVATTQDPDAFHILGGHLKAFVGAMTQHEQATVRYIKANGFTRELVIMMLIRLAVFIAMLTASPVAFLQFWLVIRVTHTINDYIFFHLVHYRAGQYATFPISLPAIIRYPAQLLYGIDVVYATMHHDIHHEHTQVAAKYLPVVAKAMTEG